MWFGHRDYKWRLIADHARAIGHGHLVELCSTAELRGLLEWSVSVGAARSALATLPKESRLEVRYEAFIEDPPAVCLQLATFIGVQRNEAMQDFVVTRVARRSTLADMGSLSSEAERIAGALLIELGYLTS